MSFGVGVEEAFQVSLGEVLVLAVPVASWAPCHSGVVSVLQAVAELCEPAPIDLLYQFDWLMAGVDGTEWPLAEAGYTEGLLAGFDYIEWLLAGAGCTEILLVGAGYT